MRWTPARLSGLEEVWRTVRFEDVFRRLRAASDEGVYVYCEEMWSDEALRRVFDDVVAFYREAARRGETVVLHRC